MTVQERATLRRRHCFSHGHGLHDTGRECILTMPSIKGNISSWRWHPFQVAGDLCHDRIESDTPGLLHTILQPTDLLKEWSKFWRTVSSLLHDFILIISLQTFFWVTSPCHTLQRECLLRSCFWSDDWGHVSRCWHQIRRPMFTESRCSSMTRTSNRCGRFSQEIALLFFSSGDLRNGFQVLWFKPWVQWRTWWMSTTESPMYMLTI